MMGTIALNKAGFLAHKFEKLFQTGRSKLETCRARKNGESSARLLFLYQSSDKQHLRWILLFKPGTNPDLSGQQWRNACTDKIRLTGYELVRHTRAGATKPAWSWRYSQNQLDLLRNSIVQAIRKKRDNELLELIQLTNRSPGFAIIREQVKKTNDLIRSEWKRRRARTESMPALPHHGYLRRLEDRGCRLLELKKAVSPELRPPFHFQ